MGNISIKKSAEEPETTELLAASIVQVAHAAEKMLASGLTKRAIIVLLQDIVGASNITKGQIELVLDNLPRLKAWYVKK